MKQKELNTMFDKLRDAAAKRATYARTVREIESLRPEVALDLGIYPGDARRLAWKAVYG
jgi:uncharacterized protein YjiS (DUF1127 family)